jgi:hypothetical protein
MIFGQGRSNQILKKSQNIPDSIKFIILNLAHQSSRLSRGVQINFPPCLLCIRECDVCRILLGKSMQKTVPSIRSNQNLFLTPMKVLVFLLVLLILNIRGFSQILFDDKGHIPIQNQTDWTVAGLQSNTPRLANNMYDVTQEPGVTWDDKVNSALDKARVASGISIIYFPALPGGQRYRLKQPIILTINNENNKIYGDNIIFQGDGAGSTILEFDMPANNNCFDVRGESFPSMYTNLTSDFLKRERTFTVEDASIFDIGDWVHLEQPNFNYSQTTSWRASIGQITQVVNKLGNTITIKDEANKDYLPVSGSLPDHATKLTRIRPIQNVGIENLKIIRLGDNQASDSDLGHNVYFKHAVNCWARQLDMESTAKSHVMVSYSSHIEVSGCYIHHSISYGSGGHGYGVVLMMSTTNCLVENNVFQRLRHAMMVQTGANANVFAYNYSREQHWTGIVGIDLPQGSDLVVHGGYCFSNLFEQNFVEKIEADISYTTPPFWGFHGINGPFNAFIRNIAARGNPTSELEIESLILKNAESTSVIGCIVGGISTSGTTTLTLDLYGRQVTQDQTYNTGNDMSHSTLIFKLFNPDIWLADVSYYYSSRPDFLSMAYNFPTIGPGVPFNSNFPNTGHIPASDRWFNSSIRVEIADPTKYLPGFLSEDLALGGTVYITHDLIIPTGRTLIIEPGTVVQFADEDIITIAVQGALLIGSEVQFVIGENGNEKVALTGSQTLTIPSSVSFQVQKNTTLEFDTEVNIDNAIFIIDANASITVTSGGIITNSLFIKDSTSVIQLLHGSNNLTVTDSEFRYPLPNEEVIATHQHMPIANHQTIHPRAISSSTSQKSQEAGETPKDIPKEFALSNNYPNPFNPSTTIMFALPQEQYVTIEVYNSTGQKVETLVNRKFSAGYHEVNWNAVNMATGIYFYRIQAGSFQDLKKMILLK